MMNLIAAFLMNLCDYTLAITDQLYILYAFIYPTYSNNVCCFCKVTTLQLRRDSRTKNMHLSMI